MTRHWGQLTAIDLSGCDSELLVREDKLKEFCLGLCKNIGMNPHGETMVDQFGEGDLYGLSAIQFIETSTITVHLDDKGGRAFVDVFSCKLFDANVAEKFSKEFWKAKDINSKTVFRG